MEDLFVKYAYFTKYYMNPHQLLSLPLNFSGFGT